jgi:very-short-patch-repair endonuclease
VKVQHEIHSISYAGEPWWIASEVCEVLGLSNPSKAVSRLSKNEKCLIFQLTISPGNPNRLYVNQRGILKLVVTCRKPEALVFAHSLGLNVETFFCASKEQHTLTIIATAFSHLKQETQRSVGKYRVDLYFPDQRIVVECDEHGHKGYSKSQDQDRQQFIEQQLNCTFVRYDPDQEDFNIGEVIHKLLRMIYG